MKKRAMAATVATLCLMVGDSFASGYRIPEQSVGSTAKAGAHIAYTTGADSSYFNPANMSWLEHKSWSAESGFTGIWLNSVNYQDDRSAIYNGASEEESFLLPTLFLVSPEHNRLRFGFSLTYPAGLSKEWSQFYPMISAEEFSLKTCEGATSVSYKVNDMVSVAAGLRMLYSSAKVASSGPVAPGVVASRYMTGDDWGFGYNMAVSVKPVDNLRIAATYRSEVDIDLESDDVILATSFGPGFYNGGGDVSIPLPAVLSLALSYTFAEQLTVEIEYDRTFWSAYENLDFSYSDPLTNPVLIKAFDLPKAKNWRDSSAVRLGLSWDINDEFGLMAGFAYDETPVPSDTLGFELPDSNALIYSLGVRYALSEQVEIGAAYLYSDKEDRRENNALVEGEFSNSGAHVATLGVSIKI